MMPSLKSVKQIIDATSPISDSAFRQIEVLIHRQTIEARTIFITEGRKNSSEYFLLSGIVRGFTMNADGEDVTISFFAENSVLIPHIARTTRGVSNLNFEAVTDAVVASVDYHAFARLMRENPEIREFGQRTLQNELIKKVNKEIFLASRPALDRLIQFRKEYTGFENLVPHHMIASFLGVTNISLSRLRRLLAKK